MDTLRMGYFRSEIFFFLATSDLKFSFSLLFQIWNVLFLGYFRSDISFFLAISNLKISFPWLFQIWKFIFLGYFWSQNIISLHAIRFKIRKTWNILNKITMMFLTKFFTKCFFPMISFWNMIPDELRLKHDFRWSPFRWSPSCNFPDTFDSKTTNRF